jgi:hypothetical protein
MKRNTENASARGSKPVEVAIAITKFKDVLTTDATGAGCGTDYVMKLKRSHARARIEGDTLFLKPPALAIRFTIGTADGTKEKYYPLGIAFVREGDESPRDRLGLLNFPQVRTHAEGLSLAVKDTFADKGKHVRYKFSVVIQRESDGRIGIVDPGIDHEGDH